MPGKKQGSAMCSPQGNIKWQIALQSGRRLDVEEEAKYEHSTVDARGVLECRPCLWVGEAGTGKLFLEPTLSFVY